MPNISPNLEMNSGDRMIITSDDDDDDFVDISTPPVQSPPEVVQPTQNVDEEYEKIRWTKNQANGDVAMHRGYWYVF